MSFNFSKMTQISALTLTALSLSLLSGCSKGGANVNHSSVPQGLSADPFDSYYGMPKKVAHSNGGTYQPKIVRKVTNSRSPFKGNAPTRYVVKKGDTLWGISNKFLKNPAYWPEVWDKNQKVRNPHLIYPGDVLFIYQGRRSSVSTTSTVVEKMVPQMRVERSGIVGDPISTLSPFLSWPRVLDDDTINSAPYIVSSKDQNILIEEDQTVYVKNLKDRHVGGEYAIFNVGKSLSDPKTGKVFGKEVTYNGFLSVDRPALTANVAIATVIESKREIRLGDRLLFIQDETHNLRSPILMPTRKIRGDIISLFDAEMISGQTQIVTINKGKRQGIKPGYTLGIYAPGGIVDDPIARTVSKHRLDPAKPIKVSIPPVKAANAIVFKVLNDISYALISESQVAVRNGYKVGNP